MRKGGYFSGKNTIREVHRLTGEKTPNSTKRMPLPEIFTGTFPCQGGTSARDWGKKTPTTEDSGNGLSSYGKKVRRSASRERKKKELHGTQHQKKKKGDRQSWRQGKSTFLLKEEKGTRDARTREKKKKLLSMQRKRTRNRGNSLMLKLKFLS